MKARAWAAALALLAAPAAGEGEGGRAPVIQGVTPSSVRAGCGDLILRVRGEGFSSSTVLRWNGSERVTAVVAPDLLTAMILASDVAQPGEAHLSAFDPTSGLSKIFVVPVRAGPPSGEAQARAPNPAPAIVALSPARAKAGRGPVTVTIHGGGFTPLSAARWRGAPRATRFVSSTTLEMRLLPQDVRYAGWGALTVRNPLPGGGVSPPALFTIDAVSGEALDRPRIYPNPWRLGEDDGQTITFENLAARSVIKIFTTGGAWVKTIPASDGLGEWDLTNGSGKPVDGGAYVYMITDGKKTIEGKLRVWR